MGMATCEETESNGGHLHQKPGETGGRSAMTRQGVGHFEGAGGVSGRVSEPNPYTGRSSVGAIEKGGIHARPASSLDPGENLGY